MSGRISDLAVVLCVACFAASAGAATGPMENPWAYRAEILVTAPATKGLVEAALPAEALDAARGDLADLRVKDGAGNELGYATRMTGAKSARLPVNARIFNQTFLPKRNSSMTADFGGKVARNEIEVHATGDNFRRRLVIEGSDDELTWRRIRDDAFLFRIPEGAGAAYNRNTVPIPENENRYLRLTLFNGPDDPDKVEITEVRFYRTVSEKAETVPMELTPALVKWKKEKSEILLDVGYRNLPLSTLTLKAGDADFFRRATVCGRNVERREVTTPGEDNAALRRMIDEPWTEIARGVIYRYTTAAAVDESLTIELNGAKYRYLRATVENGDDMPLGYQGVSAARYLVYLNFQARGPGPYFLWYGNHSAQRPEYDFAHYAARLRGDGVTEASILPGVAVAPLPKATQPWGERNKALLWVALLLGVAVLGRLLYSQIRRANRP